MILPEGTRSETTDSETVTHVSDVLEYYVTCQLVLADRASREAARVMMH